MRKEYLLIGAILLISLVAVPLYFFSKDKSTKNLSYNTESTVKPMDQSNQSIKSWPAAPAMEIDPKKNYQAVLKTSLGDITLTFDTKNSPITSNNFIFLAKNNFYNNTIFHRVISGFMIQGGDPQGTGMGGPGYKFADEYLQGEYTSGAVAMANSGPNTNGSQFFIMHKDYSLDKNYVVFAHVTAGLDIVDKIATAPVTQSASGESSKPVTPIIIKEVQIIEK